MKDLQLFEIRETDYRLAKQVRLSIANLIYSKLPGYVFSFCNEKTIFLPKRGSVTYVVGEDLKRILGYAKCHESNPGLIAAASRLPSLDSKKVIDANGVSVKRQDLSRFDGYNRYRGQGKTLCIGLCETFKQRKGIGSFMLEQIKQKEYELIELESLDQNSTMFYEKMGFIHTGLYTWNGHGEDLRYPVMVWNK